MDPMTQYLAEAAAVEGRRYVQQLLGTAANGAATVHTTRHTGLLALLAGLVGLRTA